MNCGLTAGVMCYTPGSAKSGFSESLPCIIRQGSGNLYEQGAKDCVALLKKLGVP
ncbi:hypothetical protein AALB47_13025 [Lachnospiraceae bacterium 54-11]